MQNEINKVGIGVSLDGRPTVNNKLRMKRNGYGATGDIYACSSLVGDNDFYIGNVFSGIEASLVEKTRSFIAQSMEFCRQCDDFKRCGGGCFARWYGCEYKADYGAECAMKRESIKQLDK